MKWAALSMFKHFKQHVTFLAKAISRSVLGSVLHCVITRKNSKTASFKALKTLSENSDIISSSCWWLTKGEPRTKERWFHMKDQNQCCRLQWKVSPLRDLAARYVAKELYAMFFMSMATSTVFKEIRTIPFNFVSMFVTQNNFCIKPEVSMRQVLAKSVTRNSSK